MPSIDIKVFNQRQREIRRLVRRGSAALVYSGPFGIAIIAALRPSTEWRIGKVMDRMAIIGRGDPLARVLVHKIASSEARSIAGRLSQGDVKGPEPAHAVAAVLQERNSRYTLTTPLSVEACFVQLNATPETDYLAYIPFDGTITTFHRAWFLGEFGEGSDREDSVEEGSDDQKSDKDAQREEHTTAQINERLAESLDGYESFEDLWEALGSITDIPAPVRALRGHPKLDVVVLDRAALRRHEYEKVFSRRSL